MITEHINTARTNNPKGLALFVRRAQVLLGARAEGESCPMFLAGRIAREFIGGEGDAAVLLFRAMSDVGTARARRTTGWV
jgi:hypothetical protein